MALPPGVCSSSQGWGDAGTPGWERAPGKGPGEVGAGTFLQPPGEALGVKSGVPEPSALPWGALMGRVVGT